MHKGEDDDDDNNNNNNNNVFPRDIVCLRNISINTVHKGKDDDDDDDDNNNNNNVLPRDIVCLRNISINTVHKGDDNNNNNNNNRDCDSAVGTVIRRDGLGNKVTRFQAWGMFSLHHNIP